MSKFGGKASLSTVVCLMVILWVTKIVSLKDLCSQLIVLYSK